MGFWVAVKDRPNEPCVICGRKVLEKPFYKRAVDNGVVEYAHMDCGDKARLIPLPEDYTREETKDGA